MNQTYFSTDLLDSFKQGAVIAYPTEAVFGLGCDPTNEMAVMSLLRLKNRPREKGMILIAGELSQLEGFINLAALCASRRAEIIDSWPGPSTWLLPKSANAKDYLTGGSDLIAVRVSDHPVVVGMCKHLNSAVVSTSANVSGSAPAKTLDQVKKQFGQRVTYVSGVVGGQLNPTQIRNGLTGEIIRAN